jgi:Carboxypeptidase regulatory-like domain
VARRWRRVAAALLVGAPVAASAQVVRGRVVDAVSGVPLTGAMVDIRDANGRSVQVAFTPASGFFTIDVPGAGTYQYRVAAIGYAPRGPVPITVTVAGRSLGDIRMTATVMRLRDLVAVSHGRFCGKKTLSDDTFSRLLESAHTALDIIAATIRSRQLQFQVEEIRSRTLYGAMGGITSADTTELPLLAWPVQSIDPDSLRVFGFGREITPGDPDTRVYYGPDPRVLFSDWFLDSHCFSLAKYKPGDDTLHIRFVPAHKSKLVDIAGDLMLDAHHFSLLQFTFTHQNLPNWMTPDAAGGDMRFVPLPSGLWMVAAWEIWAPIEGLPNAYHGPEMAGITQIRGQVSRVFAGGRRGGGRGGGGGARM